jgi:hypothetical protein
MRTTAARWILLFLMLSAGSSLSLRSAGHESIPAQTVSASGEKPIASGRTKGISVVLTNESGKLTNGENAICAVFQDTATSSPASVQDVRLKFTLRVGRISRDAIAAQLSNDGSGRYCGRVNLGRQYRHPASYYIEMRYMNTKREKGKLTFWATVK